MAPRILSAARGVRHRPARPLPPRLRAALAVPLRAAAVEAEFASLPAATRAELEAVFAGEARRLARRLGAQVAAGEGRAARQTAHALAGCAANYGHPRLAALARLAARVADEQDQPTARAALAALAEALPARQPGATSHA